ncbi:MAG: hypothetical protein NTY09_13965 [bacterium]|nr:hypothetical protein [bacterium]
MKKLMIFIMVGFCVSCSNHGPVDVEVEDIDKTADAFVSDVQCIFGEDEGIFYDADITEILQGPGLPEGDEGTLWRDPVTDHTWAVAVALREEAAVSNTRSIYIKFLCDDGGAQNSISPAIAVTDGDDVPIEGNICLARVASCYLETANSGSQPDPTEWTFVEVSIIFQILNAPTGGHLVPYWEIRFVRLIFDPDDINLNTNWLTVAPVHRVVTSLHDYDIHSEISGPGMMMPDIAYDPRSISGLFQGKGDLYFVWTWYRQTLDPTAPAGPRVYCQRYIRMSDYYNDFGFDFNGPVLVQRVIGQYAGAICHGFQPRIDVGKWSWPDLIPPELPQWRVSIVYTGDNFVLFPHFAYFAAGEKLNTVTKIDFRLEGLFQGGNPEDHSCAGFQPSIDVARQDEEFNANLVALVWTQVRQNGSFVNDTTVTYVDTHAGIGSFVAAPAEVEKSWSSPSVCVFPWNLGGETFSYISYLQSDNPNSLLWKPTARQERTALSDPPGQRMHLYTERYLPIQQIYIPELETTWLFGYGEYDYGAQYSNWYGTSSSCVLANHSYWVLWSSPSNSYSNTNLTSVWGCWGFPQP